MDNNSIQSPQDGMNNIHSIVGALLLASSGVAANSSVATTPLNSSQETASAAAQSASSSFSTLAPAIQAGTNSNANNSNPLNSLLSSIMHQNIPRQDELLLKQALAATNIGRTGNLTRNGQLGAGTGLANGGSTNHLSFQNQHQASNASVGHAQNDLSHFGNGLSQGQNSLLLQQQRLLQLERQKEIARRQDEERRILLSSLSNHQQQQLEQLLKNQGSSQLESQQQQILNQLQQMGQQNNSDQIANQLLLQLLCQQQSQQRQADSHLARLQAMSSSSGTGVDPTLANQNALAQLLATVGQSSQQHENGLLELILLKQKEDNIRRLLQRDDNHDQKIQQEKSTPLQVFNAVKDISSRQHSLPIENNSLSYLLNNHQRPAPVASGIASNISPMEESDAKEHFSLQHNGFGQQNFPTTIFETDQSNGLEVSLNSKKDPPKQKSKKRELPNDAPRKPLSAYNFFFSDERVRILDSIPDPSTGEIHIPSIDITPSDYKNPDGPGPATVSDKSEKTESISSVSSDNGRTGDKGSESDKSDESIDILEKSASEDDVQFAPILQKYSNKKKTKRSHSKTHGKIDFTVLSRRVGDRWRNLSKRERSYYQRLAAADSRRYKREMEEYTKLNGKTGI